MRVLWKRCGSVMNAAYACRFHHSCDKAWEARANFETVGKVR